MGQRYCNTRCSQPNCLAIAVEARYCSLWMLPSEGLGGVTGVTLWDVDECRRRKQCTARITHDRCGETVSACHLEATARIATARMAAGND